MFPTVSSIETEIPESWFWQESKPHFDSNLNLKKKPHPKSPSKELKASFQNHSSKTHDKHTATGEQEEIFDWFAAFTKLSQLVQSNKLMSKQLCKMPQLYKK